MLLGPFLWTGAANDQQICRWCNVCWPHCPHTHRTTQNNTHLLCADELGLQLLSSHLALAQLALQSLQTLREGRHVPLPLHHRRPRVLQSLLMNTFTFSHSSDVLIQSII